MTGHKGSRVRDQSWNAVSLLAVLMTGAAALNLPVTTGGPAGEAVRPRTSAFPPPLPRDALSLDGAPTRGNPSAPLVLIVFSDFECPFCASFALRVLPEVESRYVHTGTLHVAYRHLPLEAIHTRAWAAAEAAECARAQGRFWEMHDEIFYDPASLSPPSLARRAARLFLDQASFERCTEGGDMRRRVREDVELARRLNITGTPAFLLGRREVDGKVTVHWRRGGSQPLQVFVSAIDALRPAGDLP